MLTRMTTKKTKHPLTRLGRVLRGELQKIERGGAWLARQIGVVEPRVCEWSYGVREPSAENMVAMARVLGVPLAKLAGAVDPRQKGRRLPRARR